MKPIGLARQRAQCRSGDHWIASISCASAEFAYRSSRGHVRFELHFALLDVEITPDRSSNGEADVYGRGGKRITDRGFSNSA